MEDLRKMMMTALEACGVPRDKIQAFVIDELVKGCRFVYPSPQIPPPNYLDFSTKIENSTRLLNLSKGEFVGAALKQPQLFCQKPETLAGNVRCSSELLGVTVKEFVGAALKQPQLFYQKPETLAGNVRCSSELLGVTVKEFVGAALKQPSLFYQKPETLAGNVRCSSELLGVTVKEFVGAALKQPQLFYQKPETLAGNVRCSSELLGVAVKEFVGAALKRPQLFYQKPETLAGNVRCSSELLGVTVKEFVGAALKQPSLFYQKPETLSKKFTILHGFSQKVNPLFKEAVRDFVLRSPVILCLAEKNLQLRFIYARAAGLLPQKAATIFFISTKKVEAAVVKAYGHDPRSEKIPALSEPVTTKRHRQRRALCAMVRAGLLKSYMIGPA